jgi:cytidylate kinase
VGRLAPARLAAHPGVLIRTVLVISGRVGAGKSHLGQAVANDLGWPCVGFRDEVRRLALSRGLTDDRDTLADLGERLVREQPQAFCRGVLALGSWSPGQPIVVHGLRHVHILATLRDIVTPLPVKHMHVSVPDEIRVERLRERGEKDAASLDAHSTEVEVINELPRIADLVVDGSASVETNAGMVVKWIRGESPAR